MDNKEQTPTTETEPKYSITKVGEESPRSGVIRDRWSDFGDRDLLEELLDSLPKPAPNPKQIELDNLRAQLHVKEQNARKGHEKRSLLVHLFFSICYLPLLLIMCAGLGIDFPIFAFCIFAALLLGKFHYWANGAIIAYLNRMDKEDEEKLNAIKTRMKELEKELED